MHRHLQPASCDLHIRQAASAFQRALDDRFAPAIPGDVARACETLNWTIVRVGQYGGGTGYLVRDQYGIEEPYSADAILGSAQAAQAPLSPLPLSHPSSAWERGLGGEGLE